MEHSLFNTDLDTLSDAAVKALMVDFLQLNALPEERPREGWRIDFKLDLSEGFFQSVAAFANTAGGILFLGVEELNDGNKDHEGLPGTLKGVTGKGELGTRIANMIASRIDPCPPTAIRAFPVGSGATAAVVRIHPARELTMLMTGERPVYVRDNGRSVPANARMLRMLLARLVADPDEAGSSATSFINQLGLRPHRVNGCPDTFIRVAMTPKAPVAHEIDIDAERRFSHLVQRYFPRIADIERFGRSEFLTVGANGTCIYQQKETHAQAWYLNGQGQVGFTSRIAVHIRPEPVWQWSIYDCLEDADALFGLARAYWRERGYIGGGLFEAHVLPTSVTPYKSGDGFLSLRNPDLWLDRALIAIRPVPERPQMPQPRKMLPWSSSDAPSDCLASVFNSLIRDLGHAAELSKLRIAIASNFKHSSAEFGSLNSA